MLKLRERNTQEQYRPSRKAWGKGRAFINKRLVKRREPVYKPQTFYGQLQHIYVVKFSDSCSDARVEPEKPVFLVVIRNCKLKADDTELAKLDIHLYAHTGTLDVVDITSLQALVGRVKVQVGGGGWAIIDRSGSLARATYEEEAEADN
ncbi:hypothetical protein M413DRAFT_30969 [Hebeloma cylindrosporum]|uniref:Uncharacterized protein n=1 Tax=Hebeloma cylindrosporum TaxID=76867 RepID=A0A0C3BZP8_HEBCY|nr:hypothetical protein M413DRAFT_30969 [Hebeloma cylindrosporum h7]